MTDTVASVDRAFVLIFGISAAILLCITVAMLYFVVRYSRKRHPVAADITGNVTAEILWTAIPTLLVLGMFYYGWTSYMGLRTVPQGAMEVKVSARMWSWSFTYENGRRSGVLAVPEGRPVRLTITSQDVIHGLYIPAFRVKVDAVPGMTTHAWFQANATGEHDLFCSVYCGLKHADMLAVVRVLPEAEFLAWLENPEGLGQSPGKAVMERLGCLACHALDQTVLVGPGLGGVYGTSVELEENGKTRTQVVDDAYLKEAIVGRKLAHREGFDPVMPSYAGQLSDEELAQIVDVIKYGPGDAARFGARLADTEGCSGCHSTDGSPGVGPGFKGLWGAPTTVLENGKERALVVNRTYVFEVLANPDRWRTKGYDPVMPAYPHLSEDQKDALCAWLESLSPPNSGADPHAGHETQDAQTHVPALGDPAGHGAQKSHGGGQ